jgi:surface polysaccharide O-acyltransferase-like enzyme
VTRRVIWVDFAKVLAAFCVVLIHVAAPEILKQDFDSFGWQTANLLDSLSRFAPPLFFMISGTMLLGKSERASIFYSKRVSKIVFPFLFWSIFFLVLRKFFSPLAPTTEQLFFDLLRGDAYFHLWFVNAILFLYLLTPLVRTIIERLDTKPVVIAVVALFMISAYGVLEIKQYLFLFKACGHLAYFITGYLLAKVDIRKSVSIAMIAVSVAITAYLTYRLSEGSGNLDLSFYEYTSPNVIVFSIFVYLLVKKFDISALTSQAAIVSLSSLTLGIYLIHPIFLNLIKLPWLYDASYIVGVLADTGLVFFLSFASVKIISKIKYLNKSV